MIDWFAVLVKAGVLFVVGIFVLAASMTALHAGGVVGLLVLWGIFAVSLAGGYAHEAGWLDR